MSDHGAHTKNGQRVHAGLRWAVFIPLGLVAALALPARAEAQAYGYEKSQDPLILGVKAVISAARAGDKKKVLEALVPLQPSVEELQQGLGIDLSEKIQSARKSGDARRLAYTLTELVYHHLRRKLEVNRETDLLPSTAARKRLDAAQNYYEEILSFTVRRADSIQKTTRHEDLLKAFAGMRSALGSEGLFGVGARAGNPKEFAREAEKVIAPLRTVFSDFAPPAPKEIGADPPKSKTEPSPDETAGAEQP